MPNGKPPLLDESRPHTLADFVTAGASIDAEIDIKGLPPEVTPEEAVEIFGRMQHFRLKPLPKNEHYFRGGFYPAGRKVESVAGDVLFTITVVPTGPGKNGYQLTVHPAALGLLKE